VADLNSVPSADLLRNDLAMLRWSRFPGHTISKRHRTKLPSSKHVLNDTHLVTDKSNVQKVFAETAGYATRVDPMKHNGPAVMKRERNGSHSGRIVMLPRTLEPDRVYERLVDNLVDDDTVCDIRIPFILGVPPFAYTKFRSRVRRFVNSNDRVFIVSPSEVLSMAELDLCRRFCQAVGLDYGELDILRDRESGLIYIVDVNNTPAGPPKGLTPSDRQSALRGIGLQIRRTIFGLYV
jgi:hypothetical protein